MLTECFWNWFAKTKCRLALAGKEGLNMMITSTLQGGQWEFQCPGCDRKSDFIAMRNLLSAAMTTEELVEVSKKVDTNFISQPLNDVRQCGTCGTYSQRNFNKAWHGNIHRAVCYTCTKRAQHTVEFNSGKMGVESQAVTPTVKVRQTAYAYWPHAKQRRLDQSPMFLTLALVQDVESSLPTWIAVSGWSVNCAAAIFASSVSNQKIPPATGNAEAHILHVQPTLARLAFRNTLGSK